VNPAVPQALEAAVRRTLAKDPQERYVSVQGFAQVLARAAQGAVRDQPVDSQQTVALQQNTQVTVEPTTVRPPHKQVVHLEGHQKKVRMIWDYEG
jgi:hypothetical protein